MWYAKQENGLFTVGIADVELARDLVEPIARMFAAAPDMLQALYDSLPYVEDVLNNPGELACFKPGVVQAHARTMRAVIARAEGQP